jgi:hypothetical protein
MAWCSHHGCGVGVIISSGVACLVVEHQLGLVELCDGGGWEGGGGREAYSV